MLFNNNTGRWVPICATLLLAFFLVSCCCTDSAVDGKGPSFVSNGQLIVITGAFSDYPAADTIKLESNLFSYENTLYFHCSRPDVWMTSDHVSHTFIDISGEELTGVRCMNPATGDPDTYSLRTSVYQPASWIYFAVPGWYKLTFVSGVWEVDSLTVE